MLALVPADLGDLVLALPEKLRGAQLSALVVGAGATFVLALTALGKPLEFTRAWAGWGMDFSLKLTNTAGALVVAASALTLVVAALAALPKRLPEKSRMFSGCALLALGMANGALQANNLVAMLFFWQAMWAPVYGMIKAGGENAWKSSVKAVFTAGFADLMLILGLGLSSLAAESMTIDQMHAHPGALGAMGFLLMAVGAAAKLGAIPFHGWLYAAAEDAPSPFMGLVPGGLNLLMGANLLSKFPGIFDAAAFPGATFILLLAAAATVLVAGMLAMGANGYKKQAVALNAAQAGALILGATSRAGAAFVPVVIVAAAAGCCLYLTAGILDARKPGKPSSASLLNSIAAGASVAVVFAGSLYRIALHESWPGLILSVAALFGAIFAAAGILGLIRAGRGDSPKAEPFFDMGAVQGWLDRTLCDPYPAAASFIKGYSKISLRINDAISWFYDVGVVVFVGFLTSLVRRAHNGSQARYVLWVLAGSVAVIAIFALS
jgi:multicomponent Na+:H+ antiporter subunit A